MNRRAIIFYAGLHRPSVRRLGLGVGLSIIRALLLVPLPLLIGWAIDRAIPEGNVTELVVLGGVIVVLTLLSALVSVLSRYIAVTVTKEGVVDIKRRSVDMLLGVSRRFYAGADQAALHDQIVHETGRIDQMTTALFDEFLPGVVLVGGVSIVLFSMNPLLALATFAFGPVLFVASRLESRWVAGRVRDYHRAFERFSDGVLRLLRAMDLIRMQAAETAETASQQERIETWRDAATRKAVAVTVYGVTQQTIIAIASTVVLVIGGAAVARDTLTLGELISFYAGVALMRGPLGNMAVLSPTVIEGVQSLGHLYELLDQSDRRPYTGSRSIPFSGHVSLVDVVFGYNGIPVLHDVTIELSPGRVVALVGPNGSGKSTIVNLLLGFYRPQVGQVLADGVPFDDIDIRHLRRSIGVVPQHPMMLPLSVSENISFGRDPIDAADLEAALAVAGAGFVRHLPNGLATAIGEDGVLLSGGQRQRLAIARAVVHQPRLLILDEPTNHLDRASIGEVVANIRALPRKPAILLISHRGELLTGADEIVELHEGRIVAHQSPLQSDKAGRP